MAVKVLKVSPEWLIDFLSRLCGGEGVIQVNRPCAIFLSRLCGGEVICDKLMQVYNFLSRLCGGEVQPVQCAERQ